MANGNTDSTTTAEGTLGVGSEVQQSAQTSPVAGSSDQDLEPLACMTCRSRKLKCEYAVQQLRRISPMELPHTDYFERLTFFDSLV